MEPITSWSSERVTEWLKGLEAPLQQYPFEEWQLTGMDLLQLSFHDLDQLGVQKIGHQELILEAVEKLCSLTYGIGGENLRSLTEKLRAVAHSLQMSIQGRWRINVHEGQNATKLPVSVLQAVLELITAAKGLFSLLNKYQFAQLSGYTASKNIITHCRNLGTTVHKDITVYEKEKDIISICRQLVAVCDEILSSSPETLLNHTAQLESIDLVPVAPGEHLGIEITSTGSSNHYVTGTIAESPAESCEKILAGDEVIQVNDQIVVGWSRSNLVKKLQENPSGVTLVLKKVPVSLKIREQPSPEKEEEEEDKRHSFFERVTASVRSLSFRSAIQGPVLREPMGQEESELSYNQASDVSNSTGSQSDHQGDTKRLSTASVGPEDLEVSMMRRSPSRGVEPGRASISSCPEMGAQRDEKDRKKLSTKGVSTTMSRRRVSCRELGRPDCDGWLWKKKKETSVFRANKWQRFWFVLKGPTLYWYNSQQEEKAEGLIKIASYDIESAGEHKRKFVFQMCHPRFQNFIFAADNVNDMRKWINFLISAIQKHKKFHKAPPDSEEECYSETEPEDEGSHSPLSYRHKAYTKTQANTLPRSMGKKIPPPMKNSSSNPPIGGSKATGAPVDEMGVLFTRLKEGGVSLTGQEQPLTHDHFRRSFIRRNKNPVINEKVHTLRALQSTLKAKEAELQLVNRILEDTELTSQKFHEWKELNDDLYLDIERLAAERAGAKGASLDTVAVEKEADVSRLSLSDGEQLVDLEPHSLQENGARVEPELDLSVLGPTASPSGPPTTDPPSLPTESYFFI